VGPAERLLQLIQLVAGERGPVPALFPFVGTARGRRATVAIVLVVHRSVVAATGAAHVHDSVSAVTIAVVVAAAVFRVFVRAVIVVHGAAVVAGRR